MVRRFFQPVINITRVNASATASPLLPHVIAPRGQHRSNMND